MNKKCIADRSVVSTLRRCFLTTVSSVLLLTSSSVTAWLGDQFEYVPAGKESVNFEPMDGDGVRLALTHDKGGSGMRSKKLYGPYGTFTMTAKLMAGNSAGVCATFYLTSDTKKEHEFDFEFLGSPDANPKKMKIQTNYFNNRRGGHELRSPFSFDPSTTYHTYTIHWAPDHAEWFIDGKSHRRVERIDDLFEWGDQPMRVHASIWDASWWATGPPSHQIFVNYTYEPFLVDYGSFKYTPFLPW